MTTAGSPAPTVDSWGEDDDDYVIAPSSFLRCGALTKLQVFGLCCFFLETEEKKDARHGVQYLYQYPITWYRKKKETFHPVQATLTVADSKAHGPVLELRTLETAAPAGATGGAAVRAHERKGKPWWEHPELLASPPAKALPLYLVDKVAAGDAKEGGVLLRGAAPEAKELLRFDTLGDGGNATLGKGKRMQAEPNKHADKVIAQLNALVRWNRTRIAQGKVGVAPKADAYVMA